MLNDLLSSYFTAFKDFFVNNEVPLIVLLVVALIIICFDFIFRERRK